MLHICIWVLLLGFRQRTSLIRLKTQYVGLDSFSVVEVLALLLCRLSSGILNQVGRPCPYQATVWKQITFIYHLVIFMHCIIFSLFLDDLCFCLQMCLSIIYHCLF